MLGDRRLPHRGHGNVRYTCTTSLPGRLVEFTFDSVHGRIIDGRHVFEAVPRNFWTISNAPSLAPSNDRTTGVHASARSAAP
ncbi:hypothetical protein [Mycobacteroides chelonae]|uniref:hypothetical protein n=1 Tax=Mycobacteroides chelonae TaxID=1774 RepID=UPI000F81C261|nr:hypothetical protein [Mycobacteroides chelonae]